MTNQNEAIPSPNTSEVKEKFLHALKTYQHDDRSFDDLLAEIHGLLEVERSSGAWMLKILKEKKKKGSLSTQAFNGLKRRIESASNENEDQGPATRSLNDNIIDDDTDIEGDAVTDEDTVVDFELGGNDETQAIDTHAELDYEQSTEVSIPTEKACEDPIKAEGDTLNNRYEIMECIGSGGMSKVYRAVDRQKIEAGDPDAIVAVKILNRKFSFHEDWPYVLQREAEKCQGLVHQNIVEVFDFGHDGSTVYMVMEYLTGESLRTMINAPGFKGMAPDEAQHIINETGRALSFAHDHGVVHCDLKPANVIVTDHGEVKVIDFGIAQAFQNAEDTHADAQFRGAITPIYASPEMLVHEEPDPRDDIFSLACTSYQLITGQHPFNRMRATEARDIGTRLKRRKKLHGPQWRALRDALIFDRGKRTTTVAEFLEVFNAHALPWKPVIAISAGVVATAVIAILVLNQTFYNGIEDFWKAQFAPSPSTESEATQADESSHKQVVSKMSKTATEEETKEAAMSSDPKAMAETQPVEQPLEPEQAGGPFEDHGQLQSAQGDHITEAIKTSEAADMGVSTEHTQAKVETEAVTERKSVSEVSSLSEKATLDTNHIPQDSYVKLAVDEEKPTDSESTLTAQESQTHTAAEKSTDQTSDVTEFSSISSVPQAEFIPDEVSQQEIRTDQLSETEEVAFGAKIDSPAGTETFSNALDEVSTPFDTKIGAHQDTPEGQTQTLVSYSEKSLFQSAKRGDLESIDSIIESGFPLNTREPRSGATAIIMASKRGHTDVVKALVDAGADVQTKDYENMTALLWATDGGHCRVVNLLSGHDVDIEVRNDAGETALLAAAWDGYEDIVRGLLANDADVDARNNDGWSALINASINGHRTIVRELLDAGADPNLTSGDGKTALMAAAWNGHTDIVKLLCASDSAVNMANTDGWTALMNAAWNGHKDIVRILLDSGADVKRVNSDNQTAAILAVSQGHRHIATLLKQVR